MGGTKILAAIINSKDGIIARAKTATKSKASEKDYLNSLEAIGNQVIKQSGLKRTNIKAVCLGIPGSVNPHTGRVGLAPNLGLRNFFIKQKLQKKIRIPVLIENDVNLGALGIKHFGVAKKNKNVLVMFIGTGIGGALIFDGKIYRGSGFMAGEIGHMIIEEEGPLCGCGRKGCFEAIASRTAIVRNILSDKRTKKQSIIHKLVPAGNKIKSGALAEAVRKKDKVVMEHLRNACNVIGVVSASLSNLLNVDMIVYGGGLMEALGDTLLPMIKESYHKNVMLDAAKGTKLVKSSLADDAALYGGIPLAKEFLGIKI
jgi:glucokinase